MKMQTTQRAVKESYKAVIRVGLSDLQNLLSLESPEAYTMRREGWAADIYSFGDVAIVAGHKPFGDFNPKYEVCRKYDSAARKIRQKKPYPVAKEEIRDLVKEFIKEATIGGLTHDNRNLA